jgi:hypothetical protein
MKFLFKVSPNGSEFPPSAEEESKFRIVIIELGVINVCCESMKHFTEETLMYNLRVAASKLCKVFYYREGIQRKWYDCTIF